MTVGTAPDIRLREIDAEHLEDTEDNREAVQFRVLLSEAPPEMWIHEFDQLYRQTPYTLKPPARVAGDAIEITYLPRYAGELPGFLRFLTLIVRRSNEEAHRTEEMHTSNVHEREKAEFRQVLRRLELPRE